MDTYAAFVSNKRERVTRSGFTADVGTAKLFDWQAAVVEWALDRGKTALFADTGLGKTPMQLEWARQVCTHTKGRVLILAPLAVGAQTVREAVKFDIDGVEQARRAEDTDAPIVVTNYERLHLFDPSQFDGIVLDESSVLKSFMGKRKREIIAACQSTPFRLACTATPSPNDHTELGNHSEFVGAMDRAGMLSRWFVNEAGRSNSWRLKGHASEAFWDWVTSWARCIGVPSDLGTYSDSGYVLPPLNIRRHIVTTDLSADRADGDLFRQIEGSATSIHRERRRTATCRAGYVAQLVADEPDEPWIVWVETDYDAREVRARIPSAIEVKGSDSFDVKVRRLEAFTRGEIRVLVTKPKIAGFGLNWQHCARAAFVGQGYSYEAFYQAVRRCWRFGQARAVDAHVVLADTEQIIWQALSRKREDHEEMKGAMFTASRRAQSRTVSLIDYDPRVLAPFPSWLLTQMEVAG